MRLKSYSLHIIKAKIPLIALFLVLQSGNTKGQQNNDRIDSLINYSVREFNFSGVVLVGTPKGIIYQKAFGFKNIALKTAHQTNDQFLLGSISKQFTGFIILQLCTLDKLALSDKLSSYIGAFNTGDMKDITIRQLLTHTSGIADYTNFKNFNDQQFYSTDTLVKMVAGAGLNFKPGNSFQYSNSNFLILSLVAEKVTHKSFGELINAYILSPANMTSTAEGNGSAMPHEMLSYEHINGSLKPAEKIEIRNAKGAGDLHGTASDLFLWSEFFQRQLKQNRLLMAVIHPVYLKNGREVDYSSGWCLLPGLIYHTGHIEGYADLIAIDTIGHQTIIILSNSGFKQLFVTMQSILDILHDGGTMPDWLKHLPVDRPNDYEGTYTIGNFKVEIKAIGGDLAGYVSGKKQVIKFFKKDTFFFVNQEGLVRFNRDNTNKVISLSSFQDYEWVELKKTD